ncbi:MAG: ABC transporter permease [Planctomycetes bacterium]|nr:ABC transporter permease [Planctomycetota bacterium]
MSNFSLKPRRTMIVLLLLAGHLGLLALLHMRSDINLFEYFNILLLAANLVIGVILIFGRRNLLIGGGLMFLIAAHALLGQRLAPDSLTSGALLMVNILILYVGVQIYSNLPLTHFYLFVASYLALFGIFILLMENAEALFLLFLMGLAATARSPRLLAYFWTLTLSFTLCQPYPWEALFIFWFILTVLFDARGKQRSTLSLVFLGVGLTLVFLMLLPVLILLFGEDLHNIELILREARVQEAIIRTLWTATAATGVLALFCIPLGYAISRLRFRGRTLLLSLIDIPIVIPQSVAGIMLVRVFGRQQVLGDLFQQTFGIPIDGTVIGILLAQIFVAMPFFLKSALAAFDAVPEELEVAARTLGAPPRGEFSRVALPLAGRGLFLGAILAWARAAGEFGAVLFIAASPETAPIAVHNRFNAVGLFETTPLVALLLLFSLVMFFLLQFVARTLMSSQGRTA